MGAESASGAAGEQLLSALFSSHYKELLAYCARRIGRSEAEDAASEVFAVASRRLAEIDWESARPWLYGVARGVLTNRWRSLQRHRRLLARMAVMPQLEVDSPVEIVLRDSEYEETIGALSSLRDMDREVLMLAAWEDLTPQQIAQALSISRAAADQRLSRAKKRYAPSLAVRTPAAIDGKGLIDAR